MRPLLFAANWKMHLGPADARAWVKTFLARYAAQPNRTVAVFPPSVSLEAVALAVQGRADVSAGVQDIHWEPKGAFTGAVSAPLAAQAGASIALVGHSERRHVFGETDADTARKVRAGLDAGLSAMLCVGERLEEREANRTIEVVTRQPGTRRPRTPPRCTGKSGPGCEGLARPLRASCMVEAST